MRSDYNFPDPEPRTIKSTPFFRVTKESPTKGPVFYNFNIKKTDIRDSPISSQGRSRQNKEFIPFINERDELNRLIRTSPDIEAKKYQTPTNPTLYYKSRKFSKSTLRVKYMKQTKNTLSKLLDCDPADRKDQILSTERSPRKNDSALEGFPNNANVIASQQIKRPQTEGLRPLQFIEMESESQIMRATGRSTAMVQNASLGNFKEKIKAHRRNLSQGGARPNQLLKEGPQGTKMKTEGNAIKNIFLATDTFSNFYVKLDADVQRMTISSARMQRKTENDIDNLNHIMKNYKDKKLFIDESKARLTPNPKVVTSPFKKYKWAEKTPFLKTNPSSLHTKTDTKTDTRTDMSQIRRTTYTDFPQPEIGLNYIRRSPQMNFALKGQKIF